MNKLKLLFSVFIVLSVLCCSSNSNDNGQENQDPTENGKLIKKITVFTGTGNSVLDFFYHDNNKIDSTVISGTVIDTMIQQHFYENDLLIRSEFQDVNGVPNGILTKYYYEDTKVIRTEYYINNTELHTTQEYFYSSEALINVKRYFYDETTFSEQYFYDYDSNGNLVSKITDYVDSSETDLKLTINYDNEKNLYLGFKPKILMIEDSGSINNKTSSVLTELSSGTIISQIDYTYTYDDDGYPISSIASNNVTEVYEYYD